MAVLSREDFMSRLNERIGEDNSDEALSFLEDMQDTFNAMDERATGISADEMQSKLDELDNQWREKYKARFFAREEMQEVIERQKEDVIEDGEEVTFDDLFKEREGE